MPYLDEGSMQRQAVAELLPGGRTPASCGTELDRLRNENRELSEELAAARAGLAELNAQFERTIARSNQLVLEAEISSLMLEVICSASHDAIWVLDRDFKAVRANRKLASLIGVDRAELVGRHCDHGHRGGEPSHRRPSSSWDARRCGEPSSWAEIRAPADRGGPRAASVHDMSHITCPGQYRSPPLTEEHGLLVLHSPLLSLLGQYSALSRGELVLGRDSGCDLVLDVPDVSRRHARIREGSGRHAVEDLGSRNGTYVNERRVTICELVPGCLLRAGSVVLKYLPADALEALCCAKMKRLADEDTLTGLALRRVFTDALARELARSRRYGHPLCLALLDIDRFKEVNDRFGHPVGDAVLLQVASSINALVRREQLLARVGGDELALLLPDVPLAKASAFAEKIRRVVECGVFGTEGTGIGITVSIGVAELWQGDLQPEALVSRADTQLYAAKCAGRNRVSPCIAHVRDAGAEQHERTETWFRRESRLQPAPAANVDDEPRSDPGIGRAS